MPSPVPARAVHWYSAVLPTVTDVRTAVTELAVHDSTPTRPQRSVPVVSVRSVPQLTVTPPDVASLRYG